MSKERTKQYTREFKESAIRLAVESRQPIAQTARELEIKANTMYMWLNRRSEVRKPGDMTEVENLYEQIKRLKSEQNLIFI